MEIRVGIQCMYVTLPGLYYRHITLTVFINVG